MSMVLDGATPRSRKSDPVTSVVAGRAAKLHDSQAYVLEFMRLEPVEYTQGELETYFNDWSPSRIRSAVSELVAMGLVEKTGGTRLTKRGRRAELYRAVCGC